jgi:glycosyltransferase involved in cell wall biosynthesis
VSNKKRILIVHSTLHIGGAEEVTANLCRKINKDKYDVIVCYLKEKGVVGEKIESEGTPVIGVEKSKYFKTDYFTALKLRRIIKSNRIQLVHSHDVHALTDCALCKIAMPSLKFVHTFHYGNYPHRENPFRRLESLFWRVPDLLIAVSTKQRLGILDLYKMPANRIIAMWNGVDVDFDAEKFDIVEKLKRDGRIIIGSINTLIEQKGMFDLIKVAIKLKKSLPGKFAFLIAGDGHLRDDLLTEISRHGLDNDVFLIGWVKDAPRHFLPNIDVFFQPSLWEAMSMVLLEAMAAGKAIVATSVGETDYILTDKNNARIVEPADISEMTAALESLIMDSSLRQQYGDRAQSHYKASFTAAEMTGRYEQLYDSLLLK